MVLRHNIIICWLLMTIVFLEFLPINIPFESPLRVYIFGVACWNSNYSSQINQHHPWQTYLCSSPNTSPNIAQLGMGKRTLHGMFIPTCPVLRAFYRTSNLSPDRLALLAICVTQTYPECKPDNVHPGLNDYADEIFGGTIWEANYHQFSLF